MRTLPILSVSAALVLSAVSVAPAREIGAPLRDRHVITDGEGAGRILFRTAAIDLDSASRIERATLTIPFSGSVEERHLDLRLCPVTTAWNSSATCRAAGRRQAATSTRPRAPPRRSRSQEEQVSRSSM